jgi:hypothetical protein
MPLGAFNIRFINEMEPKRLYIAAKASAALFVFYYVVSRMLSLALVSDEWGHIVSIMSNGRNLVDLLVFSYVDAQSHFLQALLSLGFAAMMPDANIVIAARLPSLLGLLIYLFSCWMLTDRVSQGWEGCLAYLALCTNAHLMDYFCLARGYGLAVGFTSLSLYLLVESACRNPSQLLPTAWAIGAVWSASLAVFANLAFLNFYIAVMCVCVGWSLHSFLLLKPGVLRPVRDTLAANSYVFVNAAILFVFYLPRVLLLIRFQKLYYGGTKGFVADTVQSLIACNMYGMPAPDSVAACVAKIAVALSFAMAVVTAWRNCREGFRQQSAALLVSLVLLWMVVFNVSLFHLAGMKYLRERTALMFVPVFITQSVCFMSESTAASKAIARAIVISCVMLGGYGINFQRTWDYRAYSQTPELIDDLIRLHDETGEKVVIGVSDSSKYTLGWYAEKQAGLTESAETKVYDSGPVKQYEWLTVYSLDYGVPPGGQLHYRRDTTHVLLQRYMKATDMLFKLKTVKEYPYAETCLYEVEQ